MNTNKVAGTCSKQEQFLVDPSKFFEFPKKEKDLHLGYY